MDHDLLSRSAEKLNQLLLQYSEVDIEARELQGELSLIIRDVLSGKIVTPVEWRNIPGSYYFTEGSLRKYGDLETAYSDFKIEITGGESPVLRKLRQKRAGSL
jgi:hypothetical protein